MQTCRGAAAARHHRMQPIAVIREPQESSSRLLARTRFPTSRPFVDRRVISTSPCLRDCLLSRAPPVPAERLDGQQQKARDILSQTAYRAETHSSLSQCLIHSFPVMIVCIYTYTFVVEAIKT